MTVNEIANKYRKQIRRQISELPKKIRIIGFLAANNPPSKTYAKYTKNACSEVGINFDLQEVTADDLINSVRKANSDETVDGIMIYYPIFGDERDIGLKDVISPDKDIEGLSSFWTEKLYLNVRKVDGKKSILPCTPLAITKIIEESEIYNGDSNTPLSGKTITIFNRSEVVGKPLAAMLANDGATVYSFDISGPVLFTGHQIDETEISRSHALQQSDIVITGVPSSKFEKIHADEISPQTLCINFSTVKNFAEHVQNRGELFFSKVGPVTVTMCMRNALRLATKE